MEVAGDARADSPPAGTTLVALARIEPATRVLNVGSTFSDVVEEVLVAEGERVEKGQVLVRLASHTQRKAEVVAAELALERARLAPLNVKAQRARIRALEAELEFAREEVGSQKGLSEKGFSAGREFRNAQLRVRRTEEELNEARAGLERAEASVSLDLRAAENDLALSRAELEQTLIRAPVSGRVLRLPFGPGERVQGQTVVKIGDTDVMYAVGEVHSNEILKVKPGQRATFTSSALPGSIEGVVDSVGLLVFTNFVQGIDPTAPRGLRVVPVRIRLAESGVLAHLSNLEGQVRIFVDETVAPGAPAAR